MAIKLNGVEITSNKLNSSNVSEEKLNGVKVWPTAVGGNEWVYLFSSTSSGEYVTGETGTTVSIGGWFDGATMRMLYEITEDYPPDSYDIGRVIVVEDYNDRYYYYFQLLQK